MAKYGLTAGLGKKTEKGTRITEEIQRRAAADIAVNMIIKEDNAEAIANAMNAAIAKALEQIGLAAERFAKTETPVDTGRLRNSITHALDLEDESVYVGTNVEYAPYVELGARGRSGKKMLTHAAQNHGDYYRKICEDALENA